MKRLALFATAAFVLLTPALASAQAPDVSRPELRAWEDEVNDAPTVVEIRICDRGPGIPEAELEKVFDPFYRVEGSRSRETGVHLIFQGTDWSYPIENPAIFEALDYAYERGCLRCRSSSQIR